MLIPDTCFALFIWANSNLKNVTKFAAYLLHVSYEVHMQSALLLQFIEEWQQKLRHSTSNFDSNARKIRNALTATTSNYCYSQ